MRCSKDGLLGAIAVKVKCSITGSGLNRVAARQLGQSSSKANVLVDDWVNCTIRCLTLLNDGQVTACLSNALAGLVVRVVALINSVLQRRHIPTTLEVAVPGVASGVAGGVNEGPGLSVWVPLAGSREGIDVPSNLIKDLHETNGMRRRARTVVQLGEESDMGRMTWRVEVDPVPAGREVDASVKACFAVRVREADTWQVRLC